MSDFQTLGGFQGYVSKESAGAVTASSIGTTITASSSADTKGSYSEIVASTDGHSDFMILHIETDISANTGFLIDIAVGAASSEEDVITNFHVYQRANQIFASNQHVMIPINIASGQRVSARCQCTATGSKTVLLICNLFKGPLYGLPAIAKLTDYGTVTASTKMTTVDAGGSANTKGSYSEIVASTTNSCKGIIFAWDCNENTAPGNGTFLIDIAIGAGSSEEVIVPNIPIRTGSNNALGQQHIYFPESIAAGERIAIRCQSTITDATDRVLSCAIYGVE